MIAASRNSPRPNTSFSLIAIALWGLIAVGAAVAEAPAGVRAPLVIPFALLGPGLALSAFFGRRLHPAVRLLLASTLSLTILTVTSVALFAAGIWSGALTLAVSALISQLAVVTALVSGSDISSSDNSSSDRPNSTGTDPAAAARTELADAAPDLAASRSAAAGPADSATQGPQRADLSEGPGTQQELSQ